MKLPVSHETEVPRESTDHMVRRMFADTPVLIDIAECESNTRHFGDNGKPLHGGYKGHMIGIMQVLYSHQTEAKALGFDIYTREGNLGYSKWLYKKYGTKPWNDSSGCWK